MYQKDRWRRKMRREMGVRRQRREGKNRKRMRTRRHIGKGRKERERKQGDR